jgi:hypothetical protein
LIGGSPGLIPYWPGSPTVGAGQLAELYPTHYDDVAAVTESAEAAVADGFLRQADIDAYIAEAEEAPVPR